MTTRRRGWWPYLLGIVLAVNLAVGYRVFSIETEANREDQAFEKIGVMMRVLHLIRKDYVNADRVDYEKLIYSALRGMVGALDPFSDFMDPDEFSSMMEDTEGEFGGIGVIITLREEVLTVVTPIEGTPGQKAGLLAGDEITHIEGEPTEGLRITEAVKRLKGVPGTMVTITMYRPSTEETRTLDIERALIPVVSVKDARVIPDTKVGYVRLTQFNEPTAEELRKALRQLEDEGIGSLVIDLRNNPGGLLISAVDVCSAFLKPGTLIVSTEGRRPSQKQKWETRKDGYKFPDDKMVAILINGGSASAAEIVAGCLKDWGRAILVGEKTFGKGSVQNIIDLPDGSALRLTTAMYYTPGRQVIHEHGIRPDIEVVLSEAEQRRLWEADMNGGERPGAAEDRQLLKAVEILQTYGAYTSSRDAKFRKLREPVAEAPAASDSSEGGN